MSTNAILRVVVLSGLLSAGGPARSAPSAAGRVAVEASHPLPGAAYVASAVHDSTALGGFGASGNRPSPAPDALLSGPRGLHLVVDPAVEVPWGEYAGLRVYLVNHTGQTVSFPASDSRIDVVQEARLPDGTWTAIEHLPRSWCGNSYHTVQLPARQLWSLTLPRYGGPIETELRVRLDSPEGPIYSAPFPGTITSAQLGEDIGHHSPTNVMDPYTW